ncbi:membrane protein [Rhodopirellula maiorica SM1]|uniref:Membrane protein n=1 Tax=Rhodopirellula maiorica SM1 TaxID=1265738 RepID=M5S4F0_9BACT|nr:hypothetical protein [Rhodopirellula maiorica]EMI22522.1 membrane protein [Rhodopirellula maiorica SM1]
MKTFLDDRRLVGIAYAAFSVALTIYVACITPFRSEMLLADAWEHHAAVLTLSDNLWTPGNPTYATAEPSIRYSPYSVGLAILCRQTGITPYMALSIAAVLNTLGFFAVFWWFLRGFAMASISLAAGVCIVLLYGEAPGYANSFALSDLPWHMVNPSAFSMLLNFVCWRLLWRVRSCSFMPTMIAVAAAAAALAVSVLSHGMTGVLGAIGVILLIIAVDSSQRTRTSMIVISVGVLSLALCLAWPWYRFIDAAAGGHDPWYWFNPTILQRMFYLWCAPVYLLSLLALPYRSEPLVRWSLAVSGAVIVLGIVSWVAESASLARLPLAATPVACIAVGYWIKTVGQTPRVWSTELIRGLLSRSASRNAQSLTQLLFVVAMLYGALPQFHAIVSEPYLARPLIAPLLNREDKQPRNWSTYQTVLAGLEPGDVIFSDMETGWPVPSFGGRIVAANHLELFSQGQRERLEDSERFFATKSIEERRELIDRYAVRFILISRHSPLASHIRDKAIVAESNGLVLMDARKWLAAHDE